VARRIPLRIARLVQRALTASVYDPKPWLWAGKIAFALSLVLAASTASLNALPQAHKKGKLPQPRLLDSGIVWARDPATGELRAIRPGVAIGPNGSAHDPASAIRVVTQMVAVTCSVSTAEGEAVPGLTGADFRILDNGVEQQIAYFDASSQPASVALVIDASPSVLRDSEAIKNAADALIGALAPLDQAAVIDFSAHTYLQLPFSDVRELIRRAVARVDPRELLDDTGGSRIYEAVYLAAQTLFPGRKGRKSIVLLTDGQDSGLGLSLDSGSASSRSAAAGDRLTFDDVAKILAEEDIQIFAVSTENRPKVMTTEWLKGHQNETLASRSVRDLGVPAYTLYLAELVRRAGGQLYFLRETPTMADTFREIAAKIRAEYTLGYYPSAETLIPSGPSKQAGWHQLRVEVAGQSDALVSHRAVYYAPSAR
jgi:Ca-activated chloride channel homolog